VIRWRRIARAPSPIPRRRTARLALAASLAAAAVLIIAPTALASAGGGSSGFHGGGGGRGAGLYILIQILIRIAIFGHGLGILILIGLVLLAVLFTNVAPRARSWWAAQESQGRAARRRTAERQRRVELAAAEAAEDDPTFAPEHVRERAAALFTSIQLAWDAADRARLSRLVGPDLLKEWERRLEDFDHRGWRNRVAPIGEPTVEYVGLKHHGDRHSDRVTVRIEAKLRDYVEDSYGNHIKRMGRVGETVRVREFWTLARNKDNDWILLSIEQGAEGAHALSDQIVATPWSDEQALRDEALVEQAVADALPEHTSPAEVADLDFTGDARAAALDLSLADGRFAPDLLEIAARRAVNAWADAVDGDDAGLERIASREAAEELLHPGDPSHRTRLVVRGPRVKRIRITGLDAAADPPTMTIEIEIEGRRYVEDRDTAAVVHGSQSRTTSFSEHWTLALNGDAAQPWRIARVGAPAAHA
jgi:predicted lipid-binding transport protein (Tim44 family)